MPVILSFLLHLCVKPGARSDPREVSTKEIYLIYFTDTDVICGFAPLYQYK